MSTAEHLSKYFLVMPGHQYTLKQEKRSHLATSSDAKQSQLSHEIETIYVIFEDPAQR